MPKSKTAPKARKTAAPKKAAAPKMTAAKPAENFMTRLLKAKEAERAKRHAEMASGQGHAHGVSQQANHGHEVHAKFVGPRRRSAS